MHHLRDGLYVQRLKGGAVRLLKTETAHEDSPVVMDLTVSSEMWVSAVASVSEVGSAEGTLARSREVHTSRWPGV